MTYDRRWWIGGGLAAVLIAGGLIGLVAHRQPAPANDVSTSAPDVTLATARRGEFVERVDAQGRIGPPAGSSAKLSFAQSGIVRIVEVRVGQAVSTGQPLAELDRSALAAAVDAASADVRVAGASYGGGAAPAATVQSAAARLAVAIDKLATLEAGGPAALNSRIAAQSAARQAALKVAADRAAVARQEQLLAAGVVASKDVDAARSQLASDEADQRAADARVAAAGTDFQTALKQAQADVAGARSDVQAARAQQGVLGGAVAAAQARLDAARIADAAALLRAPADGVVLAILKHPGETVDPTVPVVEIGPALGRSVTLTVPAEVARRIATGDPATLRIPSTREGRTRGQVIAVVPAVDPATQAGTVVVSGAPADAVPGAAVTATIEVGRIRGMLVPSSAIVQDPESGKTVVFVRDPDPKGGSAFRMRSVVVRASDAATASIAAGLRPGEHVAARGSYLLLAPAGD